MDSSHISNTVAHTSVLSLLQCLCRWTGPKMCNFSQQASREETLLNKTTENQSICVRLFVRWVNGSPSPDKFSQFVSRALAISTQPHKQLAWFTPNNWPTAMSTGVPHTTVGVYRWTLVRVGCNIQWTCHLNSLPLNLLNWFIFVKPLQSVQNYWVSLDEIF